MAVPPPMNWDTLLFENVRQDARSHEYSITKHYLLEILHMTDEQSMLQDQIVDVARLFEIPTPETTGEAKQPPLGAMSLEMFLAFSLFGTEKDPTIWSEFQEWLCKKAISLLKKYFVAKFEKLKAETGLQIPPVQPPKPAAAAPSPRQTHPPAPKQTPRQTQPRIPPPPPPVASAPRAPQAVRRVTPGRGRTSRGRGPLSGRRKAVEREYEEATSAAAGFDDEMDDMDSHPRGTKRSAKKGGEEERMYQCSDCPYVTNRPSMGIRHYALVHGQYYPYLCTKCDMNFKSRDSIYQHFRLPRYHASAADEMIYQYVDEKMLDESRQSAKKNILRCGGGPLCTLEELEQASNTMSYTDHSFTMQQPRKRSRPGFSRGYQTPPPLLYRYRCSVCEFSAATLVHIQRHVTSEHVTLKPYSCNLCTESFSTEVMAKKHIQVEHPNATALEAIRIDNEAAINLNALVDQLFFDTAAAEQAEDEAAAALAGITIPGITSSSSTGMAAGGGDGSMGFNMIEGEAQSVDANVIQQDEYYHGSSFKCSECHVETTKYSEMYKHVQSTHCADIRPYICSLCSFRSTQHYEVADHFSQAHPHDAVAIITDSSLKKEIQAKVDSLALVQKDCDGGGGGVEVEVVEESNVNYEAVEALQSMPGVEVVEDEEVMINSNSRSPAAAAGSGDDTPSKGGGASGKISTITISTRSKPTTAEDKPTSRPLRQSARKEAAAAAVATKK